MAARMIRIYLGTQRLQLLDGERVVATFDVSTARNGAGECIGSECTPRGRHRIVSKIGAELAPGSVLMGRRPTGEICDADAYRAEPDRDWILSRILWLEGTEPGRNLGGEVDTLSRYIYIHGAPDEAPMGVPLSHGCVRMRNADVCELFDRVEEGDTVEILD